jgi:hypothetical protein
MFVLFALFMFRLKNCNPSSDPNFPVHLLLQMTSSEPKIKMSGDILPYMNVLETGSDTCVCMYIYAIKLSQLQAVEAHRCVPCEVRT